MAEDLGRPLAAPRVGIAGNTQSLPQMQSEVKTQAETAPRDFQSTLTNLATTPTAMGSFATNIMVNSSNALMQKWGYEQGQNPHGELLPAITDADKQFNEAYTNQAEATITLNAQKMMADAQNELNKEYKLTPALIDAYSKNMAQGGEELLQLAPQSLKPTIQNNIASNILKSTTSLNNKMIGQQKEQYVNHMTNLNDLNTKQIYEFSSVGSDEATVQAIQMADKQMKLNNDLRDQNVISETTAQANNDAIEISYMTGGNIAEFKRKGFEAASKFPNDPEKARFAQQLAQDKFLSELPSQRPEGITDEKWKAVQKNVLANAQQIDTMRARDQALTQLQFEYKVAHNTVTAKDIEDIKMGLDAKPLLQTLIKFTQKKAGSNAATRRVQELIPNWNSAIAHADAGQKVEDDTYLQYVKDYAAGEVNAGRPEPSRIQSSIATMNVSPVPVRRFSDELNNMITGGNPNEMQQANDAINTLGEYKANISRKAKDVLSSYQSGLNLGLAPVDAAAKAYNDTRDLTDKEKEQQKIAWSQFESTNLKTPEQKNDYVNKLTNFGERWFNLFGIGSPESFQKTAMGNQFLADFKKNYFRLGNNEQAALAQTRQGIENSYGITHINGYREYAFAPIEKIIGFPSGAHDIIQDDIRAQVSAQIVSSKEMFDAGRNGFYYRIKEKSKNLFGNELEGNQHAGIIVEQVFRNPKNKNKAGEVIEYDLQIVPGTNMGINTNPLDPINGSYDVVLKSRGALFGSKNVAPINSGVKIPFEGVGEDRTITYHPRISKIKEAWFKKNGLDNVEIERVRKNKLFRLAAEKAIHQKEITQHIMP